jgi:hypothetical protein
MTRGRLIGKPYISPRIQGKAGNEPIPRFGRKMREIGARQDLLKQRQERQERPTP